MMSEREYQRNLMDVSSQVARKVEPDSVYRILHEIGPSLLRDEDVPEMYADGEGRPSCFLKAGGSITVLFEV